MSDENSSNTGDSENPKGASAASSEIDALLEGLRAKKLAFEEFVASSSTAIEQAVSNINASISVIDGLKNEATTAKEVVDSTHAAIAQTAANAKANLTETEEFKTEIATIKGAIETIQTAVSADLGVVTQSKADIETLKSTAAALAENVTKDYADVSTKISSLQGQQTALQSILSDLAATKAAAENDGNTVKGDVKEIGDQKAAFINLNTDTQAHYDALIQRLGALEVKIVEIEDANTKISSLRRTLLESSDDSKSVQDEISDLREQITAILTQVSVERDAAVTALTALRERAEHDDQARASALNERFDKLHKSLQEKILALLPSAGAAGLASTYYDAKSRYAPTSYAGKPGAPVLTGWKKLMRSVVGNNPASVVATVFFYAMFILPLLALAWGTYELVRDLEQNRGSTLNIEVLALRFLVAVPLATISAFGFASLQLFRKLYEEYNHKQRVMELYRSFRDEIETSGDKEQIKALLTIMLDSVADKAWQNAKDGKDEEGQDIFSNLDKLAGVVAKMKAIVS